MLNLYLFVLPIFLVVFLVSACSYSQSNPEQTKNTVLVSDCVYYSEDLVKSLQTKDKSVPLRKHCDYLTKETARQIAKLP